MVRLSSIDLDRHVAVVRVRDDGRAALPHALRGTLAAMLSEPSWHVVVAFDHDLPGDGRVGDVLDQARTWAGERGCVLSVARYGDLTTATGHVT